MVSKSFLTKVFFIVLAAGFTAASMLSAHADVETGDYKGYAKEMNQTKWESGCHFHAEKVKQDGRTLLDVTNFPNKDDSTFFEYCGNIAKDDTDVHCVLKTAESMDGGKKNCTLERLIFARASGTNAGKITIDSVTMNDVKETSRTHILVFGVGKKKEYTCEQAYFDAAGRVDSQSDEGDDRVCNGSLKR